VLPSVGVNASPHEGRVIRADTPPRHGTVPDGREVIWLLSREGSAPPRAELVGFIDAVELEMFSGERLRRRWRFLRDGTARHYAQKVKTRLMSRGFIDRRRAGRTGAWPE
jgi:hypothetical protein